MPGILTLIGLVVLAFLPPPWPQESPDYPRMAECVAEYTYTHPMRDRMRELAIALQECDR